MKLKKLFFLFAAVLILLAAFSGAATVFARSGSAQAFPYPDGNYGSLSPSVEVIAFNAAMGSSSEKWKNVDKTSLPALENFRAEYFAAKYKLPERTIAAINDSAFIDELDGLIAESRRNFQKSFRVLAIGNSFSNDAVKYIYQIAKNAGAKNIVVASMHIAACDLKTHRANAEGNLSVYKYCKNKNGKWKVRKNVSLISAIKDESWDYITLQQSSPLSGIEKSYNRDLDFMVDYVLKNRPRKTTRLCWHMTWTFSKRYGKECFAAYNFDQTNMYNSICRAVRAKIIPNKSFAVLIPVGTAVQNLRTSYIGDRLNRDGRHLNALGQYTAAMTFVRALGFSIDSVSWIPKEKKVSKTYLPAVKAAVNDSISSPLSVTDENRICNHKTTKNGAFNTVVKLPARKATCKMSGLTEGSFCKVCGKTLKKQQVIPKLSSHKYVFTLKTPATETADGETIGTCKACGQTERRVIHRIKSVSLSKSTFTFSNKSVSPAVTVKDSAGKTLKEGADYTLSFSGGRKEVGKYFVRVSFKDKYKGKVQLFFNIVPRKTSIKSAKQLLKGIALVWNEQENVTGYIIEYGTDPNFSDSGVKQIKVGAAATGKWIETGKRGTYFVRIRTYKNAAFDGKRAAFCSAWSESKKITIK